MAQPSAPLPAPRRPTTWPMWRRWRRQLGLPRRVAVEVAAIDGPGRPQGFLYKLRMNNGEIMRVFIAAVLMASLIATNLLAAENAAPAPTNAPLAPGKIAGVKKAQDFNDDTLWWILGGVAAVGIIAWAASSGSSTTAAGATGTTTTTTTTTSTST